MEIQSNCSLLRRNTFGIEARAAYIFDYDSVDELQAFLAGLHTAGSTTPMLHIGGGSNLLFVNDFNGIVLHSRLHGIEVTADEGDYVYVRVASGTTWDNFVQYAVDSNWYGLENLSLIPGEVGAAAIQNIGAYGVEAKDFILFVDTVDLQTGAIRHFTADECEYGYRTSIFKTTLRGRYAVTHVHFSLRHSFQPNLEYGGIRAALSERGIQEFDVTPQALRQTIIDIRRQKLPDPAVLGNAGSFFTNPIVERSVFESLQKQYPDAPHYDVDATHVKVPAGWMIEQCGWKGRALGHAAVYDRQALVLVNNGDATGSDIAALSAAIQADVHEKFGIDIQPEVNFI